MKVLVACEFSGIVRDAFIERGHDAISCDLLPTERPGPHIQGDVRPLLREPWDGDCPSAQYRTFKNNLDWAGCYSFCDCRQTRRPAVKTTRGRFLAPDRPGGLLQKRERGVVAYGVTSIARRNAVRRAHLVAGSSGTETSLAV